MKKIDYAELIEAHRLYTPCEEGVYSKNYYRYNKDREIKILMKKTKEELKDMYEYAKYELY